MHSVASYPQRDRNGPPSWLTSRMEEVNIKDMNNNTETDFPVIKSVTSLPRDQASLLRVRQEEAQVKTGAEDGQQANLPVDDRREFLHRNGNVVSSNHSNNLFRHGTEDRKDFLVTNTCLSSNSPKLKVPVADKRPTENGKDFLRNSNTLSSDDRSLKIVGGGRKDFLHNTVKHLHEKQHANFPGYNVIELPPQKTFQFHPYERQRTKPKPPADKRKEVTKSIDKTLPEPSVRWVKFDRKIAPEIFFKENRFQYIEDLEDGLSIFDSNSNSSNESISTIQTMTPDVSKTSQISDVPEKKKTSRKQSAPKREPNSILAQKNNSLPIDQSKLFTTVATPNLPSTTRFRASPHLEDSHLSSLTKQATIRDQVASPNDRGLQLSDRAMESPFQQPSLDQPREPKRPRLETSVAETIIVPSPPIKIVHPPFAVRPPLSTKDIPKGKPSKQEEPTRKSEDINGPPSPPCPPRCTIKEHAHMRPPAPPPLAVPYMMPSPDGRYVMWAPYPVIPYQVAPRLPQKGEVPQPEAKLPEGKLSNTKASGLCDCFYFLFLG